MSKRQTDHIISAGAEFKCFMRLTDQPYTSAVPERSGVKIPKRFKGDACCGFRATNSPTSSLRKPRR
jgi:hypothetical protein